MTEILKIYNEIDFINNVSKEIILEEILNIEENVSFIGNSNSWYNAGLDDLSIIELIMNIEKKYNLNISDLVVDKLFFKNRPDYMFNLYKQLKRNNYLNMLFGNT